MLDNAGIKRIMIPGDAQGRPEGCIGRGNVESVGPTPTRPPSEQSPSFSRLTRRRRGARGLALEGPRARTRAARLEHTLARFCPLL